jgi:hypothetical protein
VIKYAAAVVLLLLLAFAGAVWWTLESSGVAILVTQRVDGTPRRTHVWYVESDGVLWVEAATPEREWLQDLLMFDKLDVERDGHAQPFRGQVDRSPAARERVRRELREKYGARDEWVAHLQDTSRSVAVKLIPEAPAGGK